MKILGKLDEFRGESRFATSAYAFVIFKVADKVARQAWGKHAASTDAVAMEQHPDRNAIDKDLFDAGRAMRATPAVAG